MFVLNNIAGYVKTLIPIHLNYFKFLFLEVMIRLFPGIQQMVSKDRWPHSRKRVHTVSSSMTKDRPETFSERSDDFIWRSKEDRSVKIEYKLVVILTANKSCNFYVKKTSNSDV